jgi:hypothetical protein
MFMRRSLIGHYLSHKLTIPQKSIRLVGPLAGAPGRNHEISQLDKKWQVTSSRIYRFYDLGLAKVKSGPFFVKKIKAKITHPAGSIG